MKTEGRNAVIELLKTGKNIDKILLEKGAQGSLGLIFAEARRKNIEAYADKVTDESGTLVSTLIQIGDEPTQLSLADTKWALAYEYTYEYEGVKYHVYQVHIVQSATDGYVFTYIAKEENYQTHLAEVEKVLNKIEY